MFVRLLLSLTLLATTFSQSNNEGIFSGSETAKKGAPGILPDMIRAFTGQQWDARWLSAAQLKFIGDRNAAIVFGTLTPRPNAIPPAPRPPSRRDVWRVQYRPNGRKEWPVTAEVIEADSR